MIPYYELNIAGRGIFGGCAIVLTIAAIAILVVACTSHMGYKYIVSATLLTLAGWFVLQGMMDVNNLLQNKRPFTFFADVIGNLPWGAVLLFLMSGAAAEILFVTVIRRSRRNRMTPGAIKQGLDELPDGVCFFAADGQPLLVNIRMNRICGELFDTEILNAEQFWNRLGNREVQDADAIIRTEPTILCRTRDGNIWDIHRNFLTIEDTEIHELIAYDVTRQYALNEELDMKNRQLSEVNERLRRYSREVERVTAENEILTAKIQVHDNVGRSLLAFRSYLEQPIKERDRESLLLLWRYTIGILKREAEPVKQQDGMELLLKAAQAVDVEIVQTEEMPAEGKERDILISALRECLTNTVKHAKGNKLYVTVRSDITQIIAEITNDGEPPRGAVQETGGLKNLRHTVERAGGRMTVESTPRFMLRIELGIRETQ